MEYLLSLVGKDEDTIKEAIEELAQNGEKVKAQEKVIEKLQNQMDDYKEEINFLKYKLDQKYDFIEDLELEIDKTEEKLKSVKNDLEYEKNVKANKDRMITVANEMRQESEEKCSELEHKNTVQNNVINELKHELKQKNEYIHSQEDIQKLVEDVKSLQMSNQEKELEIENISIENHNLKVKLANMEIEKKEEKEEGIFFG